MRTLKTRHRATGLPDSGTYSAHPQRFERRLIDCGGDIKTMVALIIRQGCASNWPQQAVHSAGIIALLLKRRLHVCNYLIGRQTIVAIDWPVIGVIRIWSVAPCWIPPATVPVIPAAGDKDKAVVPT